MAESTVTFPPPPLTTIFTPVPICSSLRVNGCDQNSCSASIVQDATDENSSCFPETKLLSVVENKSYIYPLRTYSPGLSCPLGMVTAGNLELLGVGAIGCCYSGFTIIGEGKDENDYTCKATLTEGRLTAGLPNSGLIIFDFSPQQTSSFQHMASQLGARGRSRAQNVVVSASPIVLLGRTLRPKDSSTTLATSQNLETSLASRSSETSVASVTTTSDVTASPQIPLDNSRASEIGAGVGGSLETALFLGHGAFLVKRYRRKRLHKLSQDNTLDKEEKSHGYDNKPELEGSEVRRKRLTKAELDALAIRAELEGSPGEEYGTGINVLKPELQGSQGVYGLVGIGVKKKAELEGSAAGGARKNLLEAEESASANGQPKRNDAGPVAELEAHGLPYKMDIGNGRPASNKLSRSDNTERRGTGASVSSDGISFPQTPTELVGSQ